MQVAWAYFVIAIPARRSCDSCRAAFTRSCWARSWPTSSVVGLIVYAAGGARSGLGVLMITPTAGAAILSTPLLSMFIAATASLVLLAESLWRCLLRDVDEQATARTAASSSRP